MAKPDNYVNLSPITKLYKPLDLVGMTVQEALTICKEMQEMSKSPDLTFRQGRRCLQNCLLFTEWLRARGIE